MCYSWKWGKELQSLRQWEENSGKWDLGPIAENTRKQAWEGYGHEVEGTRELLTFMAVYFSPSQLPLHKGTFQKLFIFLCWWAGTVVVTGGGGSPLSHFSFPSLWSEKKRKPIPQSQSVSGLGNTWACAKGVGGNHKRPLLHDKVGLNVLKARQTCTICFPSMWWSWSTLSPLYRSARSQDISAQCGPLRWILANLFKMICLSGDLHWEIFLSPHFFSPSEYLLVFVMLRCPDERSILCMLTWSIH